MAETLPPQPPGASARPRGKPSSEGRFIWASSYALERILNGMGQTQAAFGVAIYMALCRMSSRAKNNPVIICTVQVIAGMARLSYRKTFEILHELSTIGVITITPGTRNPGDVKKPISTYTLISLHNRTVGKLHNSAVASCTESSPSRADIPKDSLRSRESLKNNQPPVADGCAPDGRSICTGVVMKGLPE